MRALSRRQTLSWGAAIAMLVLGAVLVTSPLRAAGQSAAPSGVLASGPPFWLPVASMHNARSSFAAVEGHDGRIYAIGGGGILDSGVPGLLDSVEAYTPLSDTWQPVAPLARAREGLAAASGPDGRIYAIAGQDGSGPLSSVEAYQPGRNRWVATPPALYGNAFAAAVRGPDGRIYLGDGSLDAYDTQQHRWRHVSAMPTARSNLEAV